MLCPRCPDVSLLPRRGALGEDVCPSCGGRFLEREILADLCTRVLGVDEGALVALAAARGKAPCPSCRAHSSPVTLKGAPVWLCGGCGGAFFEPGALTQATLGLVDEVLPGPVAVSHHRALPRPARAATSVIGVVALAALAAGVVAFVVADVRQRNAPQMCLPGQRLFERLLDGGAHERLCLGPDGGQEGPYAAYDGDGTLRVRGNHKDGWRDGEWSFFDARGRLRTQGTYSAVEARRLHRGDVRTGWWRRYHPDGRVREEGAYANDERTGQWGFVDDYGVDRISGTFAMGVPIGTFSSWLDGKETLGPLPAAFFIDDRMDRRDLVTEHLRIR